MKRFGVIVVFAMLAACTPVIQQGYIDSAAKNVSYSEVALNPSQYKGKLLLLGGVIVSTRIIREGSLVEATYAPVDRKGYLKSSGRSSEKYLAFYPGEKGLLEPSIYSKDKQITIAAEVIGTQTTTLGGMELTYPYFEIKEIYLWPQTSPSFVSPPYPSWHYYDYPSYRYQWNEQGWKHQNPWYPY